jgi:hypothetical protein
VSTSERWGTVCSSSSRDILRRGFSKRARAAAGAGSVLAFLVAVATAASLPSRPAPGQVPGYAAEHGFDPRTDVLRLLLLCGLPVIGGAAGLLLGSRRRDPGVASRAAGSVSVSRRGRFAGAGLRVSAAIAHGLTVWTFLVVPLDGRVPPLVSLIGIVAVSWGLVVVLGRGDADRGAVFLAAASPTLPLALLGPRPPGFWIAAAAAAIVLPILARGVRGLGSRVPRPGSDQRLGTRDAGLRIGAAPVAAAPGLTKLLRALLLWVLLPGSVTVLVGAAILRAPTVADVFEDGHFLLPASEYLRGELPYRDIVPGHGLLSDGLLQTAQLSVFGDDYLGLKRGNKVVGALFLPAIYALGWAATGSAAVGFGGLMLTLLLLPNYLFFRALLSLWTLVFATRAARTTRTKSRRAWAACGAALPLGLCMAVDFTVYAAAAVAVALWVARGDRLAHLRRVLAGAAVSAVAVGLTLGAFGLLRGFLHTTFVFVPSLMPVYALGFPPLSLHGEAPSLSAWLRSQTVLDYLFFAIAAPVCGALLPRGPRVGARARGVLPLLAWFLCANLSVIERHHAAYALLPVPVGLLLLHRWALGHRRGMRPAALATGFVLVVLVLSREPLAYVGVAARAVARPWTPPDARKVENLARAEGAVFVPADAALVGATREMIRRAGFRPGDTWLDFANAPGLYYLFDRDCPIRYYEVPFYESEAAQDEVIASLSANPRVRAVLMSSGLLAQSIDDLTNAERAPRVAAFLRERFRPFYREGPVEFWIRKEEAEAGADPPGVSSERP